MSDVAETVEDGGPAEPDLGILPKSSATPPASAAQDDGDVTPSASNGQGDGVRKEWLLIRLGHRLCGFRG